MLIDLLSYLQPRRPLSSVAREFLIVCAAVTAPHLVATAAADDRVDFFESRIRPVLVKHCYECHSGEAGAAEAGLRVDSRDALLRGGDSGPAVRAGEPGESLLLSAIRYETLEMPPDQKLPARVVADFERWIAAGAADPRVQDQPAGADSQANDEVDLEAGRRFWSFRPPRRHPLPPHRFEGWPRGRIDHFVAAKLESEGLDPSPAAGATTLLRRLSFDLVGLPPDAASQAFQVGLSTERGYEAFVDHLLGSPAFGEHWARLWLDVMRYADDQAHIVGNNRSLFYPNAYLYRAWVVDAFNRDLPYDRFLTLQLAADLCTPDDPSDDVALGFVGLGPKYYRRRDPEVKADEWEDRVDTLSRGLLGLTVACARCHDHKYDPISTEDYYGLAGVFASTEMFNRPLGPDRETDDDGQAKEPADALHVIRDSDPKDLAVMIRGDANRLGDVVQRRFLSVLDRPGEEGRLGDDDRSGRLDLAARIASRDNPLTARVFVNRVWAKLIGRPLVDTPSNFGTLGSRPTHPELLDDLAVRFMENGWSLKWLCREIVTSAAYRQRSVSHEIAAQQDPDNRWLWRMNRKRLSVEQWRDSLISAAGLLERQVGGENLDPSDPQARRRTLYSEASRLKLNRLLALFDYPDPNAHSAQRVETTTPTQKLFLMNSPFMVAIAEATAERITFESPDADPADRVERAYEILFGRQPAPQERAAAENYLAAVPAGSSVADARLDQLIHALLMTNETLFVD